MDPIELEIDGENWEQKREALRVLSDAQREVSALARGHHRLEIAIVRHSRRRTARQLRYYFPCFVKPLVDYLRAQNETDDDGNTVTAAHVHRMWCAKFLRDAVVDKSTGEILGSRIRETKELDTAAFNAFLDQVAQWLAEKLGFVVPPPSVYHEPLEIERPPPTAAERREGEIVDEYETDDPDARDREIETLAGTPRRLT